MHILTKKLKYVFYIFVIFLLPIITLSSLVNIFEKKDDISKYVKSYFGTSSSIYDVSEDDLFWARELLKGGYILHFRHAERDKWIDVQMYDALESDLTQKYENEVRYAENDYFSDAVCLNERGKTQAIAIGEHIANIGLPIGLRVSSVSCRARQTAELAFGGFDSMHRILVHNGPYNEESKNRISSLRDFYLKLPIVEGKNTIVSSHNGVIFCEIFDNYCGYLSLEEGGFYVISNKNGKLILEHEFHNYNHFNRIFYKR
tara:strand:+ start:1996 stop:2772 length:777 start_codon:yes stop_codon:yes gene_type:complete